MLADEPSNHLPIEQLYDRVEIHYFLEAEQVGDIGDKDPAWNTTEETAFQEVLRYARLQLPSPGIDFRSVLLSSDNGQQVMGSHDCQDTLLIDIQLQISPDSCSHMPIADGIPGLLLDGADVFDDCNQIGIRHITT